MPARGAITLFHVRGIRIGADVSWFVVLFLVIVWLSNVYEDILGPGAAESEPYLLAVVSALAFFASILLHELGHALVAMRNGIEISEITLWLFGGIAHLRRDSDSAGVEFRVAAAGPAVTLLIAAFLTGLGIGLAGSERGFIEAMAADGDADVSGPIAVVAWLASINLLVLLFNLVPAYPLDGGRIVRAIAWKVTGDRNRGTRFAAALGQGFSYAFIALGLLMVLSGDLLSGIWLALIGLILGSSARGAAAQTELASRLGGLRVADVMDREPVAVPQDTTVERALEEFFLRYRWPWFPVTDAAGRFRGLIVRDAADAVPEQARGARRVADVFEPDASGSLQVRPEAPLDSVLGRDSLARLGALLAVDEDGTLRGVLTAEQLGRAIRDRLGGRRAPGPAEPS